MKRAFSPSSVVSENVVLRRSKVVLTVAVASHAVLLKGSKTDGIEGIFCLSNVGLRPDVISSSLAPVPSAESNTAAFSRLMDETEEIASFLRKKEFDMIVTQ